MALATTNQSTPALRNSSLRNQVNCQITHSSTRALVSTRSVYLDGEWVQTPVYDRERLRAGDVFAGPAIVTEYSSATVVPPGDVLRVDELRNLIIEVHP